MIYIAHRGNNDNEVENRVDGILKTINLPYIDGVEVDIHMTKDGKFVLSHNLLLKETVFDYHFITQNKLKFLKKKEFVLKGKPFPIHTLEELLRVYPKDKILMIECKTDTVSPTQFEKNLYKILKKNKNRKILLCSFDYFFISHFKKKYPLYSCGLLVGYTLNKNKDLSPFDFVSLQYRDISLRRDNTYIWTVNDIKILNKVKKEKIEGIVSDCISFLLKKDKSMVK